MWRELDDPDNPENHNAGNGGDLVKHTVYLTLLEFLLAREPWRSRTVLRECHAGRGIYRLDEERGALVARLLEHDHLALARAQRAVLGELGASGWYAGSALLLAHALARGAHAYHGYEWDPATRSILDAAFASVATKPNEITLPLARQPEHFDGETHLMHASLRPNDVVLLDPFGLWHHDKHAFRRERYRRIFEVWQPTIPLAMFWTWGRALDRARADLDGRSRIDNGYVALAAQLGAPRIVVRWTWQLAFAMWVVVPEGLDELRHAITTACEQLFETLAPPGAELDVGVARR